MYGVKEKVANSMVMFFLASVIGWIWEEVFTLYRYHIFANRGFLHGPWLPIYGTGFLLILFLKRYVGESPIILFIWIVIVCGCLEYFTSALLEVMYHTRWWNYRDEVWNIKERVCFKSLLLFGIVGNLTAYIIIPYLDKSMRKIKYSRKKILLIIIISIFMMDVICSIYNPNMKIGN